MHNNINHPKDSEAHSTYRVIPTGELLFLTLWDNGHQTLGQLFVQMHTCIQRTLRYHAPTECHGPLSEYFSRSDIFLDAHICFHPVAERNACTVGVITGELRGQVHQNDDPMPIPSAQID